MRHWIAHDLRYAARSLRKAPTFTAAVVLTLALGIGATASIFAIADAVLLKTLPVSRPDQLFFLAHGVGASPSLSSTYPLFARYRAMTDVFDGVAAYMVRELKVSTAGGLEGAAGQYVSGNYHQLLGVRFALGRGFDPELNTASGAPFVAVISDGYWARAFGRDPRVLGRSLAVDGRTLSIVGVTAPGFNGLRPGTALDVTVPLPLLTLDDPGFVERHDTWTGLNIVGRIRDGMPVAPASERIDAAFRDYVASPEQAWLRRNGAVPDAYRTARLVEAGRGTAGLRTQYDRALRVLLAMVSLLLAIACANVAHLILVRGSARQKEIVVRVSLGATRWGLVRQLLTENLLLAAGGGALGLLLAVWAAPAIVALFRVGRFPVVLDVELDARVLTFTIMLSLLTALASGMLPALRAARPDLAPALKSGRSPASGTVRFRASAALTVVQIAIAAVLLAASGALVRSLHTLTTADAGFEAGDVLLFYVTGTAVQRNDDPYSGLVERLRTLPGAAGASISTASPLATDEEMRPIVVPGRALQGDERTVLTNRVSPGYFDTFGIALLRGRDVSARDSAAAQAVAVVSESMARTYFDQDDPVGRQFFFASTPAQPVTVVGVVRDVRQQSLRRPSPRLVYLSIAQAEERPPIVTAAIRTDRAARALEREARATIAGHDGNLMVSYVRTLREQQSASLVRERILAWLSSAFGFLAVLLACVGLYGVVSYTVRRRTHEIGVRLALGASPGAILRRTLGEAFLLSAAGATVGLAATLLLAPVIAAFTYGPSLRDPITLGGSVLLLLLTTLLAAYHPARTAAAIEPMRALDTE